MQPLRHGPPAAGGWGGVAGVGPTTVDEASMERSKSFIKALQELKNLRPQLYSASEYCEKSYLHSEQKQMVLDNLKDYAVRAVVNAVDHLGTVAYKLTDLFEQQASEVSSLELKVSRLNQQIFTCQIYTDKEGLRQQQMMGTNIKHHKHYILPSTGHERTQAHLQTDTYQESKPRPYPSAKTLSWHLASENSTTGNGPHKPTFVLGDTVSSKLASGKERSASPMRRHLQLNRSTSSDAAQRIGAKNQSGVKDLSTFHSFDNPKGRAIQKAPVGTKSMLAALFIKHKSAKMKKITAR
ncbi:probable protein ABIL4 [Phragmites australis]|uniref:probable protein ABIL4 n=1 Tax=Phragmites australis TaxID=29695 RepID=UPI002D78A1E3|nr:probable protein ABIL4 [Phragmites australis]